MAPLAIEPFRIEVPDGTLDDLRARLLATRWPPDPPPAEPWQLGTDSATLRSLVSFWATEFDWRAQETTLNERPHFVADVDRARIHFVHERAPNGHGIPLILTHGWPSAFIEYLPLVDLLSEAFDVVVPSLPGYGFSDRPNELGVNYRHVAGMWHELMRALGYERYAVGGGDFGAGVASLIALDHPESVIGVHLTNFELLPGAADLATSTTAEDAFIAANDAWWEREKGYKQIQSTKPQTLSYGLADSPAGLAAWLLEKWRTWTDCGGDPELKFGRDFLLTLFTLYWLNGSIATSVRDYYDNRWHPSVPDASHRVERPTAFAVFGHDFGGEVVPPRTLVERLYNVTSWTEMPRGGHFAPIEEPELVAEDLREFFADTV